MRRFFADRQPPVVLEGDGTPGEEAVRTALEVTGLYGDPEVTWGISVELVFDGPVDLSGVDLRLADLVREHPHVGAAPEVERVAVAEWDRRREEVATARLGEGGRLVRVLVCDEARRVLVTAHHGVCDGLGLLALASAVVGRTITTSARGIGDREARRSFLLSSILRLLEALFRPPARFAGSGSGAVGQHPDLMLHRSLPATRLNGARACVALLRAYAAWPRNATSGGRRFLVVMGASRRESPVTQPDRQTTFFRIPLPVRSTYDQVVAAIRAADPEPDFPETSAKGVGPLVTRLLRNRLGYTVNVSNLGVLSAEGLVSGSMYPALAGPMAVGVGLVSTATTSTVSLRMRRSDFTEAEAARLMASVVSHLPAVSSPQTRAG